MDQNYLLIVGLLFSCITIPFGVSANRINQLEKEIEQMKFAERMLKTEHLGLTEKFSKLKKECDNRTKELEADDQLKLRNDKEMRALNEVKNRLHNKQFEEGILVNALNMHNVIQAKHLLQEELLRQSLDILASRRVSGVAEKCHKLEHFFDKNSNDVSARSLGKLPSVVDKDTIITLENTLNLHKLSVKKLQDKNTLLRQETESYRKLCLKKIQNLKEVNILAEEQTKAVERAHTLAKKELSEVVKNIEKYGKQLNETKEAIRSLKEKVLILTRKTKTFSKDEHCYKKVSELYLEYTPFKQF